MAGTTWPCTASTLLLAVIAVSRLPVIAVRADINKLPKLWPSNPRPAALPRALEAIAQADLIVLGPGSLYTSLLPNLLVPQLVEAIGRSQAPRLYICNLMTQPGETDGLDVAGHLRAIEAQLATHGVQRRLFDAVLAQEDLASGPELNYYRARGAEPVHCEVEALRAQGYEVMLAAMQGKKQRSAGRASRGTLRHEPRSLALAVMRFYRNTRSN